LPTKSIAQSAEIAHAVLCLASPLSSSITGTLLAVDGGMQGLRVLTIAGGR